MSAVSLTVDRPTIYVKGGDAHVKDEFQGGKLVKLEEASYEFLIKWGYLCAKGQPCNIFFRSKFDDGGFITHDITGDPINVHSRAQEKDLMRRHDLVHGDKNSKAKNRLQLGQKSKKFPGIKSVNIEDQHRAVKAHFEDRKNHRTSYVKTIYDKYARAKISDF